MKVEGEDASGIWLEMTREGDGGRFGVGNGKFREGVELKSSRLRSEPKSNSQDLRLVKFQDGSVDVVFQLPNGLKANKYSLDRLCS